MRTLELMPVLSEKGVRFSFCTLASGKGQLDETIRELGGEVLPCPLRPGVWSFGRRFVKLLKQSNYDIVHSHGHYFSGYVVWLAYKVGIKGRIVHFRITYDGQANTLPRRLYRKIMYNLADRYATSILAVCRGAMEFAWGKDWQKDPRAQVIYNGLDLSRYQQSGDERARIINEFSLPKNSKLVINVGRMCRQKAQDVLLDAAAKVIATDPTFHLLLVGDGVLRAEMEAKAKALNIASRVHFLGVRGDVPRLLKASDYFVLSSRWEGLPGVVLEAVAANLPVVATDLPGVREIADCTDLVEIVPVEDSDALADGILRACENTKANRSKSHSFPEEFGLQRCAEKLYEVYVKQMEE